MMKILIEDTDEGPKVIVTADLYDDNSYKAAEVARAYNLIKESLDKAAAKKEE